MDLSASTLVKGVDIQKKHVLMFYPIKRNSVDEHQPFQPKMISWYQSNKPKTVIQMMLRLTNTEIMREKSTKNDL